MKYETPQKGDFLAFATIRNEEERIGDFIDHHRALSVDHFFVVLNDSEDGTAEYLEKQPDVSVWTTASGYKASRFGVDWLGYLKSKFAHDKWTLTLDADERLIYPFHDSRCLKALCDHLDRIGAKGLPAMMLDLYPKGHLGDADLDKAVLWFDPANYSYAFREDTQSLWVQGGPRARCLLSTTPERAPTLNKIPLIKWNRRYAHLNSTHTYLPTSLNEVHNSDGSEGICGILLHSKFQSTIVQKSKQERDRKEHFFDSAKFDHYYDGILEKPSFWTEHSKEYRDWMQLEELGLISRGSWV